MHPMFSDWYHTVQPTADRTTVEKRWAATSECASGATKAQTTDLATYIARADVSRIGWFRAIYKNHDDVMPTRGIEEELRVLAAIVLHVLLETTSDVAPVAAFALLTCAFGMKDEPTWLGEHLVAAAKRLSTLGAAKRTRNGISIDDEVTAESVNGAFATVQQELDAITESNMCLWWALTNHSRLVGETYKALGASVAAMVAPVDFIGLIRLHPPSPEAETLVLHVVSAAGADSDALSLRNYVSGLGRDRAQQVARSIPSHCVLLCPLLWATSAAAEGKSWPAEFEKLFGIKSTGTYAAPVIALQLFRELCLTTIFAE